MPLVEFFAIQKICLEKESALFGAMTFKNPGVCPVLINILIRLSKFVAIAFGNQKLIYMRWENVNMFLQYIIGVTRISPSRAMLLIL